MSLNGRNIPVPETTERKTIIESVEDIVSRSSIGSIFGDNVRGAPILFTAVSRIVFNIATLGL